MVLENLRSAYNVGNIFRLAEVCRVAKVITCGYTATPPHPKLRKTARGCDDHVICVHYESAADAVVRLKKSGYQAIAVETVAEAPNIWDLQFRFPVALIFGNEAHGISTETLNLCDHFARLPVFGRKNSLNVSNCAAVATYAAVRQWMCKIDKRNFPSERENG